MTIKSDIWRRRGRFFLRVPEWYPSFFVSIFLGLGQPRAYRGDWGQPAACLAAGGWTPGGGL